MLHGIMGTLVYTRETFGQFSLRRLQLGVSESKGHTLKGMCAGHGLCMGQRSNSPFC